MSINNSISDELKADLQGEVLVDDYSRGMYATDASIYQIKPVAVILPKNESDVKKAIEVARKNGIKILPRGGGTSLAGQTVGEALVMDFSKYMNKIMEINEHEKWARVQPGLVRDELNEVLTDYNLHFAPDPATSSRANIGGMIGNNSSGTKSVLYGKTIDHVLELKVLLADGTVMWLKELSREHIQQKAQDNSREVEIYRTFSDIIQHNEELIEKRFPKVMRRVGGYSFDEFIHTDHWNLSKIITGSEGTLATILEAKINLEPLPACKSVAVVHFSELSEALKSVKIMLNYQPAAIEILDDVVLTLSRRNLITKRHCHFLVGDPAAVLITEFYGDTPEEVRKRSQKMIDDLKDKGLGYAYPLFPEGEEYDDVWTVRKKGLGLMLGMSGNKKPLPFIEDVAVPVEVLPVYIEEVGNICKKYNTEVSMYAHASVGVIHVRPILDLRQDTDIEKLKCIANETFKLVLKYGGSWSGEHGDGLVRSPFNKQFFGSLLYQAFKELKQLFDPENLMNPGKIVDAEPMDQNLRYGTQFTEREVITEFQYRSENSFSESVHMCTGVGECRKMLGGTMCPSFKATRDEEHSTRGRANALRLAISGQLDEEGLTSDRLQQVLDLCLSCKACKSECPSNVDMAKMKSEVTQMYYDEHGVSLRDHLIRTSSDMARMMSGPLAKPVNYIQKSKPFRTALHHLTGLHKNRILPAYASQPFEKWFEKNNTYRSAKKVVLFADTYLNYHEPQIGISAVELLNSCGYEVVLAQTGCCQRPRISHGFLREAKKKGAATITGLKKYLDRDLNVVVCEPSCASALNDDFPDLVVDQQLADQLREQIMMIDDFLAEEIKIGNLTADFELKGDKQNHFLHGHCHQKALYGTASIKSMYNHENQQVEEIPSGCCGMAGSFGYEKDHYHISRKIGERVLFPAVRELKEEDVLIANGFSCRHQIEHFTGVKPKHWVEVVQTKTK